MVVVIEHTLAVAANEFRRRLEQAPILAGDRLALRLSIVDPHKRQRLYGHHGDIP